MIEEIEKLLLKLTEKVDSFNEDENSAPYLAMAVNNFMEEKGLKDPAEGIIAYFEMLYDYKKRGISV